MANEVTLKVVIKRAGSRQCQIEFFRKGNGDDMVEDRADRIESACKREVESLLGECGGQFTKEG